MAMWIVVRKGKGRQAVTLVYHNLIKNTKWNLGSISSDWTDQDCLQWIFDNAEQLTPGDFIKLSDGRMFHWDGRAFFSNGNSTYVFDDWCRSRQVRANS